MINFIGKYTVKVDDKGRIIFPAAFKNVMPAEGDMRFVIRRSTFANCLEMYTWEGWESQANKVKAKLDTDFNETHDKYWRAYMNNCAIVEPDGKLGRLSIPKQLLELIGVNKEVTFSGLNHKIEIWAKENLDPSIISNEEFLSIAATLR